MLAIKSWVEAQYLKQMGARPGSTLPPWKRQSSTGERGKAVADNPAILRGGGTAPVRMGHGKGDSTTLAMLAK